MMIGSALTQKAFAVVVGTFTETVHVFSADTESLVLSPLCTSTEFGTNHEAMAVLPSSTGSSPTTRLVVGNNNCASPTGLSGPEHYTGEDAYLRTASLRCCESDDDVTSSMTLQPSGKVKIPGLGPIHACVHPSSRRVAVANYGGGTIDVIGPIMENNNSDDVAW